MKKRETKLEGWEITVIGISIIVLIIITSFELICSCLTSRYPVIFSILVGLSTGILSALTIFYAQRWYRDKKLFDFYSKIEGLYKRINIGQDNTGEAECENMRSQNNDLEIKLSYKGENIFTIDAKYWKHENASVNATIEFNESNKMVANGYYHYVSGKSFLGHFGRYTIYFNYKEDNNKILALYHHLFPRDLIYNPDNNRGWEVWEKQPIQ